MKEKIKDAQSKKKDEPVSTSMQGAI
jgi:hypothetical protein